MRATSSTALASMDLPLRVRRGKPIRKKGRHSVGVARQYCGQIGKQDNCQIAITLSVAHAHASLPVGCRLYLPDVLDLLRDSGELFR
jgi:hypothetical protein